MTKCGASFITLSRFCSNSEADVSSIFSSNSEARASELLENIEEMFPPTGLLTKNYSHAEG